MCQSPSGLRQEPAKLPLVGSNPTWHSPVHSIKESILLLQSNQFTVFSVVCATTIMGMYFLSNYQESLHKKNPQVYQILVSL